MNSFTSTREWQSVREQGFTSKTKRISFDDAKDITGFKRALELFNLWSELDGDVPQASMLRPALIPSSVLPSMMVLDVLNEGADFRWRLFGTEHTHHFGLDATGMRMSVAAKYDTSAQQHYPIIKECHDTGKPILFMTKYSHNGSIRKATYNVALPLADETGKICRIFGCSMWL